MTHESRPRTAIAEHSAGLDAAERRFIIEDVYPTVNAGRFPIKRVAGEAIDVWADIFRDGHDVVAACLRWRAVDQKTWHQEPMTYHSNDRWMASFIPPGPGRYVFAIEAWTDTFGTWRRDFLRKRDAGMNIDLETREGREILSRAKSATGTLAITRALAAFDSDGDADVLLDDDLAALLQNAEPRTDLTWSAAFPVTVDRALARASAWYEIFPRSQSAVPGQHGTFDDVIARLPEIAALGFDVLYFPPIHPIGRTNRKGRNNTLTPGPDDPGSPYAIGSEDGGHEAIHPQLGTVDDFRRLVDAAAAHGIEIALDFAIQCSPDHPWVKQHPDWFRWRPDGTMRYAENPPKKYEDIVNPDFYCDDRLGLWTALRDVVLLWLERGVRIFRVDNPHTKPFPFWEWLIREVQARDPGVIFLAEAFTRPKVMKALAKLGFTQSYTYFTWRTSKADFTAYLTELTGYPERDFYRPNFFVNTPDILPFHLQSGEPWMFKSRVALAATLSGNYGVYSGFELLEHAPIVGKEEYLDSEKYEIKTRDWDKPGNIKDYIAQFNRIRRTNPALLQTSGLRFANVEGNDVIAFVKESPDHSNTVAVAIALAPLARDVWLQLGDIMVGPPQARRRVREVENLMTGERRRLEWGGVKLWVDSAHDPALLLRCIA